MEMPDEITVWDNGRLFCRDDRYAKEPIHSKSEIKTYHHDRIVQSLRRENEELKAKLDKAEYGLKDIARQYKSTEWEEEGDTEYGYDMIIERARTTLEEIE